MDNKLLGIILVVCVVLIGFSILLNKTPGEEPVVELSTTTMPEEPTLTMPEEPTLTMPEEPTLTMPEEPVSTTLSPDMPLSEMQVTACNAADRGGTCETRLPQIGRVSKEDCCKYLGKCC